MDANTITAIAYLLTSAVEAGLSISQVLKKARETGVVPYDEWPALKTDSDRVERIFLDDG
jgi:hypothetical protein